jgi:hypothetical protein
MGEEDGKDGKDGKKEGRRGVYIYIYNFTILITIYTYIHGYSLYTNGKERETYYRPTPRRRPRGEIQKIK